MTKREDVNVDYNNADKAAKATENVMNHMQDVKEGMSDNASKVAEDTPTTPEEFINKKGFTAWRAAEEVKTKQKQKDTAEKFAVDLDKYLDFADNTCSEFSKDHAAYIKRLNDLQELGCNISRLDTAASGLSAESGEFMEIVKKMKTLKGADQSGKELMPSAWKQGRMFSEFSRLGNLV